MKKPLDRPTPFTEKELQRYFLKLYYGDRLKKYGLSLEKLEVLIEKHPDCSICKKPLQGDFHVDHSHRTGKVRGLLCQHCNHLVGHIEASEYSTDAEILKRAIAYLKKHQ